MVDFDMVERFTSTPKSNSVSKMSFSEDLTIDAASGYEPKLDDLVATHKTTGKHYKYDTENTDLEIEGVIVEYNDIIKNAVIATNADVQIDRLNVIIGTDKTRNLKRSCRSLGINLY